MVIRGFARNFSFFYFERKRFMATLERLGREPYGRLLYPQKDKCRLGLLHYLWVSESGPKRRQKLPLLPHFFTFSYSGFFILLRRSLKVKIDGGKMKLGDRIVDLAMCGEGELSLNGMAMVS